jgi:putative ABC transport system permease protein
MSLFGTGALGRVVRSGVGRRRVQTVVIAVATMMAVAAAVIAGSLIVVSNAPFDHAFAKQHGPHVTAQFDPAKVSAAQLRRRSGWPASPRARGRIRRRPSARSIRTAGTCRT